MTRASQEARRARAKARPKEGANLPRLNHPSREGLDGRLLYMNLVPHVQRHFDHVVSSGLHHGHPFVECVQVAMDECAERYVWNMVAVVMDLHEATNDSEYEQRLRAFRATGAYYDTSLEAFFPLFRGAPPVNHPHPGAWATSGTDSPTNQPYPEEGVSGSGYIPFAGHGRRLESSLNEMD
jgi:hypothetical protein